MPAWLESLLLGVAGGLALAVTLYVARIPSEVRRHNRMIRDRDEDLATWVADTKPVLDWRLTRIATRLAARGALQSGELNWRRAKAKEAILHAYRDQERAAKRFVAAVELSETWGHRAYRWVSGQAFPALSAPDRAEPVLDHWREDAVEPGQATVKVVDPTRTTLEDVVHQIREERAKPEEAS